MLLTSKHNVSCRQLLDRTKYIFNFTVPSLQHEKGAKYETHNKLEKVAGNIVLLTDL